MPTTNFETSLTEEEAKIWNTDHVFKPVSEWSEDIGSALFFSLDSGEPPEVTSPVTSGFDSNYFTHWMPIPKELSLTTDYRSACIKSGIETTY